MTKNLDQTFKEVFSAIMDSSTKDTVDKHGVIIEQLKQLDMEHFDLFVRYPLKQCVASMHKTANGAFIYSHYDYVEDAFSRLMEEREGFVCCVDKGRYITKGLYKYFEEGIVINFQGQEYWQTHTFTNEQCIQFFEAIVFAYHGRHVQLFEFYRDLALDKEQKS